MRRIALLTIAIGLIVSFWAVAPASATNPQSYISGIGNDMNPCTRSFSCLSLVTALANTNAGGEIDCIDTPGALGLPAIAKSITIDCTGVAATLTQAS